MTTSPRRLGLALLTLLGAPSHAPAAAPVFHGALVVRPASGPIGADGTASLTVHSWALRLGRATDGRPSNGIDPAGEPIIIAIGEQTFLIPAASLRASRTGTRFAYSNRESHAVRTLHMRRELDGSYAIRFSLTGIDLSALTLESPICRPLAVIIGDDDGFTGVELVLPTRHSRRFRLRGPCDVSNDWPWIQG